MACRCDEPKWLWTWLTIPRVFTVEQSVWDLFLCNGVNRLGSWTNSIGYTGQVLYILFDKNCLQNFIQRVLWVRKLSMFTTHMTHTTIHFWRIFRVILASKICKQDT